jgi:demethylmenaquinone methyltransferase / 2-methoxy-6-polyprenyl-1,4-benzoquinol methylase
MAEAKRAVLSAESGPAVIPPRGTLPEGAQSEAEASRKMRQMFTEIAPRYDFLNHLLSLELDRVWRSRAARILGPILRSSGARVLDLCCGTGDLAFALAREGPAQIVGADFSHPMLQRANAKWGGAPQNSSRSAAHQLRFVEADALRLPLANSSLDLVTTAFGFRNLANYESGLHEIHRVLKPRGTIAILEFSDPPPGLVGDLYRLYCRKLLPKIGALLSGNAAAYKYLPASVARFFRPEELSALLEQTGFRQPQAHLWTFKSVALHVATKP